MNTKFTIDRFEGDKAVLRSEDGTVVVWPKNKLPDGAREGSALFFSIQNKEGAEKENKNLAKKILNEILNIK
ncbi:MAG: DUF3006 domain-containing protein [Patescibacteria group bacterium]